MFVLISQRHTKNNHGDWIDSLENSYVTYFNKFGIKLIPVPNVGQSIEYWIETIKPSGLILSGGNDVDPELYGMPSKESLSVSMARDNTEIGRAHV